MKFLSSALILAAAFGCNQQKPGATSAPAPPAVFTVVTPRKMSLPKFIEQPGTVLAYEETPLYAKFSGFVKKIHVYIGDQITGPVFDAEGKEVRPGSVLAELSIPELEDEARQKLSQVDQVRAEVEQAQKQIEIADATLIAMAAHIREARAGIKRADANLARWEAEEKRIVDLVRSRVIDRSTGDEVLNQRIAAGAAKEETQERLLTAEKNEVKSRAEIAKAHADLRAVQAKLKVAEADADRLQTLLRYRFIRAPFNGKVTRRWAETGDFVQPPGSAKAQPLYLVAATHTIRVVVDVPETDAGLIRKDAPATVKIQAMATPELQATVSRTSESIDATSHTLRVEIDHDNTDGRLIHGMYAYARIRCEMPPAWALPANAVVKLADISVCYLYKDGNAVRMVIQPGRTDGKFTEVLKKQVAGAWVDWTGDEQVLSGATGTLSDRKAVEVAKE